MVHSISSCCTSFSCQHNNHGNQYHHQESLFNAARGAECFPLDMIPNRSLGLALRNLADVWYYERSIGYQMRTIADELNARHQRGHAMPGPLHQ